MSINAKPTTSVSLYDAKTHLSELGDRAAAGEEIIVTKHGKPRFKLVAIDPPRRRPLPGSFPFSGNAQQRAELQSIDWFAPDEDIERLFGTRE